MAERTDNEPVFEGKSASERKRAAREAFVKKAVFVVAIALLTGLLWHGMSAVAGAVGSFGRDAYLSPLKAMWLFKPVTFVVGAALLALLYFGITNRKVWFLLPLALVVFGIYWSTAARIVVKLIQR